MGLLFLVKKKEKGRLWSGNWNWTVNTAIWYIFYIRIRLYKSCNVRKYKWETDINNYPKTINKKNDEKIKSQGCNVMIHFT